MRTDLSKYDNSWYHPGAGRVKMVVWYLCNVLLLRSRWMPLSAPRRALLRLFGARIGRGVVIRPGVSVKYPWRLSVGDYTWIGEDVWIDNLGDVTIGSHCCISQGAMLLCGNHNYRSETFDLIVKPITIEDGAWVGAKSVVCPGVTVGDHGVLAVGSVASRDVEARMVYRGNPASKVTVRL